MCYIRVRVVERRTETIKPTDPGVTQREFIRFAIALQDPPFSP